MPQAPPPLSRQHSRASIPVAGLAVGTQTVAACHHRAIRMRADCRVGPHPDATPVWTESGNRITFGAHDMSNRVAAAPAREIRVLASRRVTVIVMDAERDTEQQ